VLASRTTRSSVLENPFWIALPLANTALRQSPPAVERAALQEPDHDPGSGGAAGELVGESAAKPLDKSFQRDYACA
jgi:hypothetical protein